MYFCAFKFFINTRKSTQFISEYSIFSHIFCIFSYYIFCRFFQKKCINIKVVLVITQYNQLGSGSSRGKKQHIENVGNWTSTVDKGVILRENMNEKYG